MTGDDCQTTDMDLPQGAGYSELLAGQLTDEQAQELLSSVGFENPLAAARRLVRLAVDDRTSAAVERALRHLLKILGQTGEPDRILVNLERFAAGMEKPRTTWRYLASNPRAVDVLVSIFAGSRFLTEIVLRHPDHFERLSDHRRLAKLKGVEQLVGEARSAAGPRRNAAERLDGLRRFQRWEMLRIGAADLLGLLDLQAVVGQLSNVADCLVQSCLDVASGESGMDTEGFAVLALGKLGGQELNYEDGIDNLITEGYVCLAPLPCHDPRYDADGDLDVDQADFAAFQVCITGSGGGVGADCGCFDWNSDTGEGDGDVDNEDYGFFERCASGPGIPAVNTCDDPPPP